MASSSVGILLGLSRLKIAAHHQASLSLVELGPGGNSRPAESTKTSSSSGGLTVKTPFAGRITSLPEDCRAFYLSSERGIRALALINASASFTMASDHRSTTCPSKGLARPPVVVQRHELHLSSPSVVAILVGHSLSQRKGSNHCPLWPPIPRHSLVELLGVHSPE